MISNNETDQLMRDATAAIEKQRRTIQTLTTKVARLESLLDRSPEVTRVVARDPELLMKTVDALLAQGPAPQATRPRNSATEQTKASEGRLFTRHGGNVLPALRG
jgi:hypothetical protein